MAIPDNFILFNQTWAIRTATPGEIGDDLGQCRSDTHEIVINPNQNEESIRHTLTHELIHVSQKHTKKLEIKRNGHYYWNGIPYTDILPEDMSYQEYKNLPWEIDVQNRETLVLQNALELLVSTH